MGGTTMKPGDDPRGDAAIPEVGKAIGQEPTRSRTRLAVTTPSDPEKEPPYMEDVCLSFAELELGAALLFAWTRIRRAPGPISRASFIALALPGGVSELAGDKRPARGSAIGVD
jgi:hypothetical protein